MLPTTCGTGVRDYGRDFERENLWLLSVKWLDTNLPLIHLNLALTYHSPNEVMCVSAIFPQKSEKVCDINLT